MKAPPFRRSTLSRRALLRAALPLLAACAAGRGARAATAFREPLFKLFVIAEMMRLKRTDLGSPDAFHARLLGRPHDAAIDGYRANPKAMEYFAGLALGDADLAAAERLDLDGGNPVFKYVDPNWAGYTTGIEPFARLDDVGLLPNLVRFENTAFLADGTPISFAPFRGLARLRMIGVSIDRYADLDALLDLPALKAVRLFGNAIYDDAMTVGHPARRTLESLKARGVDVWVHWISRSGPASAFPPFR